MKLKERSTQLSFCISSIYGPNDPSFKAFFLEICNIHALYLSKPWALIGDFNMTKYIDKRQDCEGNIGDTESFNDLIRDNGLIEIPLE